MSSLARIARTLSHRCRLAAGRLRRRSAADGGFVLLESIISISLITVIMSAVGVEYVSGVSGTALQRAQTAAVQLADSAVEDLRALHPSDLVTGRDHASADAERQSLAAVGAVQPWVTPSAMQLAYDPDAPGGGATATVPTVAVVQKPLTISFDVYEYLGWCWTADSGGVCTATPAAVEYLRAVVAVIWNQSGCPDRTCSYVTSTLIDTASDPAFDLNQPLPPAPVIASPGNQTVAVGDVVGLQLQVQDGKGVAPFTWAITTGSLPDGLALSPSGLITGTVAHTDADPPTPYTRSVTITVTDGFIRSAAVTFSWTVLPQLVFTPVPDQASLTTDSVSLLLRATGGQGPGYTFTDPAKTLPPGLVLSPSGTVSGTPSTPAPRNYTVRLTVTDGSGKRTATTSFTWAITYPPLSVSRPSDQSSTQGTKIKALQFTASGGDGSYSWTAAKLPTGLSMSSDGTISGTPTAPGSATVTVTGSDASAQIPPQSVAFTWTVFAAPTVTTPGGQQSYTDTAVNLRVVASCPNAPCTYSMSGQPTGLVIDPTTGVISGTVAHDATTSTAVQVAVTDQAGALATTAPFTWTIFSPPALSGLAAHSVSEGQPDSVAIRYSCPRTNCTLDLSNAVPGIGLAPVAMAAGDNSAATSLTVAAAQGTVYLTGTVQADAVTSGVSRTYSTRLTITDSGGRTPAASTATWTAYAHAAPTVAAATGDVSIDGGRSTRQTYTYTCAAAPCTVSVSGAPSGIGLDANTTGSTSPSLSVSSSSGSVYLRGTVPPGAAKGSYTVVVTITDTDHVTTNSTATWTVT